MAVGDTEFQKQVQDHDSQGDTTPQFGPAFASRTVFFVHPLFTYHVFPHIIREVEVPVKSFVLY